jgi:uncharacterized protein YjdB
MKKTFLFLSILAAAFACGCSDYHNNIWDPNGSKATGLTVDNNDLTVKVSKTALISATVTPSTASNAEVIWESGNTSIATVDETGLVTGVSAGSTIVRVLTEDRTLSAECDVTVKALGTDNTLSAIDVTPDVVASDSTRRFDILQPSFSSSTISYLYAPVKYGATKVTVKASSTDSSASILISSGSVTNSPAPQGSATLDVSPLSVGANTVTITVTPENGGTANIYTISVYKAVPVFKTGQTNAVSGYNDDGTTQYGISRPAISARFTKNSDGSFSDSMTELVWTIDTLTPYCIQSTLPSLSSITAGYRMPNIRELRSLTDYSNSNDLNASYGSVFGISLSGYPVFSANAVPSSSTSQLILYIDNGRTMDLSSSSSYGYLLFVKSNSNLQDTKGISYNSYPTDSGSVAWPSIPSATPVVTRFRTGNNTVIDNMTGLQWYYSIPTGTATWDNAMNAVVSANASSSSAGFSDWRMPNVNELETLVRFEGNSQSGVFSSPLSSEFWTSTATPQMTAWSDYAWYISFSSGVVDFKKRTISKQYMMVRGFSETE